MDSAGLRARLISGVLWLGATKAVGQAVTWGITIAVLRILSPQDYGLMSMAVLLTGFLLLFHEIGLGAAIVQREELSPETVSQLRWALLLINSVLFGVLLVGAPAFAAYFGEPAVTNVVRVLSLTFIVNAIGVPSSCMLQREMAFRRKSQAELAGNLVGSVATLVLAASGYGVWSLVSGYLLQQVITNALYCVYSPVPFVRSLSLSHIKPFVNFGFQVAASKVLWYFSSNADFLVVGRVLGAAQLGFYGLAFQFSSLPIDKVVSIVTQVALPSFAVLQSDSERLARYYLKLVGTVALVTFPMFIGLSLMADDAVALFLTAKWLPIVLPLKVLCVVSCLRAIETMNTPLLLAKGRPGLPLFNNVLQAIVLPVSFFFGAQWGLNGVALAWLVAWPVLFIIVTGQTLGVARVSAWAYAKAVRHAIAGCALMAFVVTFVRATLGAVAPSIAFTVLCLAGAVAYFAYQALLNQHAISEIVAMVRPARAPTGGGSLRATVDPGERGTREPSVAVQRTL